MALRVADCPSGNAYKVSVTGFIFSAIWHERHSADWLAALATKKGGRGWRRGLCKRVVFASLRGLRPFGPRGAGIALRAMSIKSALRDLLSVSYVMIGILPISSLRSPPKRGARLAPRVV